MKKMSAGFFTAIFAMAFMAISNVNFAQNPNRTKQPSIGNCYTADGKVYAFSTSCSEGTSLCAPIACPAVPIK